jgi:hypothetical protein
VILEQAPEVAMQQLRSACLCVSAALTLVGLALITSRFVPGLDTLLPAPDGFLREQQRHVQLWDDMAGIDRVLADKHDLTGEVIAGRVGLVEAARRFRDLDTAAPQFNHEAFCRTWPGRTDEERYCREVLGFVRTSLNDEPDRRQVVLGRLETEMGDYLRRTAPTYMAGATGHGPRPVRD